MYKFFVENVFNPLIDYRKKFKLEFLHFNKFSSLKKDLPLIGDFE